MDAPPSQLLISLEPVFARLRALGYDEFEEEGILINGIPIQFLHASPGLESEAVEAATVIEWDQHRMRVMTPEHLAAIALTV
jgi:hypothetical protein